MMKNKLTISRKNTIIQIQKKNTLCGKNNGVFLLEPQNNLCEQIT
jgi:hypothetical protein